MNKILKIKCPACGETYTTEKEKIDSKKTEIEQSIKDSLLKIKQALEIYLENE